LFAAGALAALLAGCGEPKIRVGYLRPARYQVPATVRSVAIAPFSVVKGPSELGRAVADDLAEQLRRLRDEVAPLEGAGFVPQEVRRLETPRTTVGAADAMAIARSSGADALIHGSIEALAGRGNRKRLGVSVSFRMEEMATAGTILALTVARQGQAMQSSDETMADLCRQCVSQFVEAIAPQMTSQTVSLEAGQDRAARKGNSLAAAGKLRQALECYSNALDDHPCDAGVMFNAGVMCELTGDVAAAQRHYAAAVELYPTDKFAEALERVSGLPSK